MFYLPDLSSELVVNIYQLLQVFKHFLIARKHKKIRKQNIITIYNYKKKREEKDEWLVNLIVRTPQIKATIVRCNSTTQLKLLLS